nr:translation initiation factor IF-2-like isoform X2 [Pan troglodytes]
MVPPFPSPLPLIKVPRAQRPADLSPLSLLLGSPRLHLPSPTHLPGHGRQPGWGLGKGGVAQGPGRRAGAARRPAFLGAGPAPAFPTRPHPVAAETRPRPPQRTKHPHFAPPRPSALGPPLSRQAPLESAARPPAGSRAQPGCLVSPGRATSLPPQSPPFLSRESRPRRATLRPRNILGDLDSRSVTAHQPPTLYLAAALKATSRRWKDLTDLIPNGPPKSHTVDRRS